MSLKGGSSQRMEKNVPIYKREDIVAFHVDAELVCTGCVTKEEEKDLERQDVITEHEVESNDDIWFCDRCGDRLQLCLPKTLSQLIPHSTLFPDTLPMERSQNGRGLITRSRQPPSS